MRDFDPKAFHYANKKSLVRDLWICAGLLMLATQDTASIAVIALGFTFLSFIILDETA